MSDTPVRHQVHGGIQPCGCNNIDIGKTLGTGANNHSRATNFFPAGYLADNGPENDVCQAIHVEIYSKLVIRTNFESQKDAQNKPMNRAKNGDGNSYFR